MGDGQLPQGPHHEIQDRSRQQVGDEQPWACIVNGRSGAEEKASANRAAKAHQLEVTAGEASGAAVRFYGRPVGKRCGKVGRDDHREITGRSPRECGQALPGDRFVGTGPYKSGTRAGKLWHRRPDSRASTTNCEQYQEFLRVYSPRNTVVHVAPLSVDFSHVCSIVFGVVRTSLTRLRTVVPCGPPLDP
jgi:hypothetical protein